jgi:hypothetical protein
MLPAKPFLSAPELRAAFERLEVLRHARPVPFPSPSGNARVRCRSAGA